MSNRKEKEKTSIRVTIVAAMLAFSAAAFIFLVENVDLPTITQMGFMGTIIFAADIILLLEILFGLTFLISTGIIEGYEYEEKYRSRIKWLEKIVRRVNKRIKIIQRRSYDLSIKWFFFSVVSAVYNVALKIFGVNEAVGIWIAIFALIVIIILATISIGILKKKYGSRTFRKRLSKK